MKWYQVLTVMVVFTLLVFESLTPASAGTFTYGRVRLEYAEPPTPTGQWHFRVWAVNFRSFQNGELLFCSRPADGSNGPADVVLWQGRRGANDTIYAEFTAPSLPPGDYMIFASLVPFPELGGNDEHTADCLYITVRENQVLTDRGSWSGNYYREILQELETRGLKGANDAEIQRKAPDLAERIRSLSGKREHFNNPDYSDTLPVSEKQDSVELLRPETSGPSQRLQGQDPGDLEAREIEEWNRMAAERGAAQRKARDEAMLKRFGPGPKPKRGVLKPPTYDSTFENLGIVRLARPPVHDTIDTEFKQDER